MAITVRYRLNGGEVIKISHTGNAFAAADKSIYGVLTDPSFPDGTDYKEILSDGTLNLERKVGFTKIAIPGSNLVRNATQAEIDTFQQEEDDDEDTQDADATESLIKNHRVFKKLVEAIVDEINAAGPNTVDGIAKKVKRRRPKAAPKKAAAKKGS